MNKKSGGFVRAKRKTAVGLVVGSFVKSHHFVKRPIRYVACAVVLPQIFFAATPFKSIGWLFECIFHLARLRFCAQIINYV